MEALDVTTRPLALRRGLGMGLVACLIAFSGCGRMLYSIWHGYPSIQYGMCEGTGSSLRRPPFDSALAPLGLRTASVGGPVRWVAFSSPGVMVVSMRPNSYDRLAWVAAPESHSERYGFGCGPVYWGFKLYSKNPRWVISRHYYIDATAPYALLSVFPRAAKVVLQDANLDPIKMYQAPNAKWAVFARSADGFLWTVYHYNRTLRKQTGVGRVLLNGANLGEQLADTAPPIGLFAVGATMHLAKANGTVLTFDTLGRLLGSTSLASALLGGQPFCFAHLGNYRQPAIFHVVGADSMPYLIRRLILAPDGIGKVSMPDTLYRFPLRPTALAVRGNSIAWAAKGYVFLMPLPQKP